VLLTVAAALPILSVFSRQRQRPDLPSPCRRLCRGQGRRQAGHLRPSTCRHRQEGGLGATATCRVLQQRLPDLSQPLVVVVGGGGGTAVTSVIVHVVVPAPAGGMCIALERRDRAIGSQSDLRQTEHQQLRPFAPFLTTALDAFSVLVMMFGPMLLVDADSLVLLRARKELSPRVKGSKLITALPGSGDPQSALEFVLRQLIYMAETWMSRARSHEASILPIFGARKSDRVTSLLAGRPPCNRATIVAALERYGQEIARAAEADLVPAALRVAESPAAAASGRLPEGAGAGAFALATAAAAVTAEASQQSGRDGEERAPSSRHVKVARTCS
jgi:hypothetical protein